MTVGSVTVSVADTLATGAQALNGRQFWNPMQKFPTKLTST